MAEDIQVKTVPILLNITLSYIYMDDHDDRVVTMSSCFKQHIRFIQQEQSEGKCG